MSQNGLNSLTVWQLFGNCYKFSFILNSILKAAKTLYVVNKVIAKSQLLQYLQFKAPRNSFTHLATGAPVKQQRRTQNFVFIDMETSNTDHRGTWKGWGDSHILFISKCYEFKGHIKYAFNVLKVGTQLSNFIVCCC